MSHYCYQVRKISPNIEWWTGKQWSTFRYQGKTYTARGIHRAIYELRRHYEKHGCKPDEIQQVPVY